VIAIRERMVLVMGGLLSGKLICGKRSRIRHSARLRDAKS
jgi:hypothetical protein